MKGIIFNEFFEMTDQKFGMELTEQLISQSELSTDGAYTAVGTYPHQDLVSLVVNLSKIKNIPIDDLQKAFGVYLFARFNYHYEHFFENVTDALDFLESIENYIHIEVKKLYPEAELPKMNPNRIDENTLELTYHSEKAMAHFALGLIKGCLEHFDTEAEVKMSPVTYGQLTDVVFRIKRT